MKISLVVSARRVYEVFVKMCAKPLLGVLVFTAASTCCAQCITPSPLSRHVSNFRIGPTTVLNALLWLGHDNGVCFGLAYSGSDLTNIVQVDESETTVGEVARKILGSTYRMSVSEGVVLIQKRAAKPPSWLNHRLTQFNTPKAELMNANALLWMTLEMNLDKSKHGFGGSGPVTEPSDEIGPLTERNKTVQQLLVSITASSHGASWFLSSGLLQTSFDASVNRFWTLATYSTRNLYRPQ
jgi:hypothetical protein